MLKLTTTSIDNIISNISIIIKSSQKKLRQLKKK